MATAGSTQSLATHAEGARRDALVVELTRSEMRLQRLCEIGKLLTRFQSIDETVPRVVALVAETVPLRSVIFVQTRGTPLTLTFQAAGEPPQQLRNAKTHAQAAYGSLVPDGIELGGNQSVASSLPELCSESDLARAGAEDQFVLLPFIVNRGVIFGALQVQAAQALEESDLVFVSAVVDQLSAALERDSRDRLLLASEAKLAGILAMAADAVITVDEQSLVVMYNDGAERIFGWSAREVLGKPIEFLIPERLADTHRKHMRNFHTSIDTSRKMGARLPEIFGRRKNGEEFHADAAISKLVVAGHTLCTVIVRDITERKRAEREEAFLAEVSAVLGASLENDKTLASVARLAMRGFADFCVIEFVDERGELTRMEVVSADPAKAETALALKHFSLDRTRPHLCSVILGENRPQIVEEVTSATLRSITQDKTHLSLFESMDLSSIMGVPLRVGGRSFGALVVGSGRPRHRFAAAELQLLEKVGERAALALESARLYRVAQRAVQARDDVLGVVAHDLRNPLGSILMQATLLRRKGPEVDRRSRKPGQVIERAAKRMNGLIQDLLDVTSMEAGQLSLERNVVPVSQLILELVESQHTLAASRSLSLQFDPVPEDLLVWADRERLLQVLENLVGNAAKFTPSGGRISLGARERDCDVLFWVADTGAGISAEDLPHLFDRFWQVRRAARQGAGLGLAIVKGLIDSHGGRIWIESKVGFGSTFYFTIPPAEAG